MPPDTTSFIGDKNAIKYFTPASFQNCNSTISKISLNSNLLAEVDDSVFNSLPALEILALNSQRETLTWNVTESNLISLSIANNSISDLDLSSHTSLKQVDVSSNKLSDISLPSGLISLDLSYNEFTENLPNDVLSSASTLEILDFSGNRFDSLDDSFLSASFQVLTSFSATTCNIKSLDSSFFNNAPNLQSLTLGTNQIQGSKLADDVFKNSDLYDLDLSNNLISTLPNSICTDLPNLESLDLAGNLFSDIGKASTACSFDNLVYINLSNNEKITSIDENSWLSAVGSNATFVLQNSGLTSVADALTINQNMGKLVLDHSKIASVGDLSQSSLYHLSVRSTLLTSLDDFSNLSGLTYLDLSENEIASLTDSVFTDLNGLEYLGLARNNLTTLDLAPFEPLKDNLKVLTLENNPWNCDCSAADFKDIYDWELDIGPGIICQTPAAVADQNLKDLDKFDLNCYTCPTGCSCNEELFSIDCSDSGLTSVPAVPAETRILILANNQITSLNVSSITGLVELDVSNNKLASITSDDLASNNNLIELDASSNSLTEFSFPYQNWEIIDLSDNNLATLANDFYNNGHYNDSRLSLASNKIDLSQFVAISSDSPLNWLDLSNNNIDTLVCDPFSKAENLYTIDLSLNKIEAIPSNCAIQAKTINFQSNALTADSFTGLGTGLSNLQHVTLDDNDFSDGFPTELLNLNLERLDANNVGLTSLDDFDNATFSALTTLTHLGLSDNALTSLTTQNNIFEIMALKICHLNNNQINDVIPAFGSSLVFLEAQQNKITSFDNVDASNLEHLDLHQNSLTSVSTKFSQAAKYIDISDNDISSIDSNSFDSFQNIEFIDISKNSLTVPDPQWLSFVPGLNSTDLNFKMSPQGNGRFDMNASGWQCDENANDFRVQCGLKFIILYIRR